MKLSHLFLSVALTMSGVAVADQLDDILEAGVIRVGTTGDYNLFLFTTARPIRALISMSRSIWVISSA